MSAKKKSSANRQVAPPERADGGSREARDRALKGAKSRVSSRSTVPTASCGAPAETKDSTKTKSNRQNARKSTGPKTPQGRTKSSQNAVKHGLYAKTLVIDAPRKTENKQDYLDLVESLFKDLEPQGHFQEDLVYKIAECIWRRRRVIAAETAKIRVQLDEIHENTIRSCERYLHRLDDDDPDDAARLEELVETKMRDLIDLKSIPESNWAVLFQRYEMRLDRQLTRAFKLLKELKQMDEFKKERDGDPQKCGWVGGCAYHVPVHGQNETYRPPRDDNEVAEREKLWPTEESQREQCGTEAGQRSGVVPDESSDSPETIPSYATCGGSRCSAGLGRSVGSRRGVSLQESGPDRDKHPKYAYDLSDVPLAGEEEGDNCEVPHLERQRQVGDDGTNPEHRLQFRLMT
ncbi:MAG: hypothetical protein AB1483_13355 [Candidatus Zixiibacteriota bacterium]